MKHILPLLTTCVLTVQNIALQAMPTMPTAQPNTPSIPSSPSIPTPNPVPASTPTATPATANTPAQILPTPTIPASTPATPVIPGISPATSPAPATVQPSLPTPTPATPATSPAPTTTSTQQIDELSKDLKAISETKQKLKALLSSIDAKIDQARKLSGENQKKSSQTINNKSLPEAQELEKQINAANKQIADLKTQIEAESKSFDTTAGQLSTQLQNIDKKIKDIKATNPSFALTPDQSSLLSSKPAEASSQNAASDTSSLSKLETDLHKTMDRFDAQTSKLSGTPKTEKIGTLPTLFSHILSIPYLLLSKLTDLVKPASIAPTTTPESKKTESATPPATQTTAPATTK